MINFIKKHYVYLFLLLILSVAFLLRSKMFLSGDLYLLPDQGRDLQLIQDFLTTHRPILIGAHAGFGGLFHGPLWLYMITPFFIFSGGNPFLSLVPVYFGVSLSIVIIGFIVGKKLYGNFVGIVLAFFIAISNTFISTILFTSNAQVMPLIFILYFFTIIKFIRGETKWIVPSIFLIGLGFHFESAFAVVMIVLTLFSFLFAKKLPAMKYLFLGLILFVLSISNFILFDLRHQFLMSHSFINIITKNQSYNNEDLVFKSFSYRIRDRAGWAVQTIKAPLFNQDKIHLFSVAVILIAGLLFVFKDIKTKKYKGVDREIIFLFTAILISYSLYVFYPMRIYPHYVQSLFLGFIILFSLLLYKVNLSKFKIVIYVFVLLCLVAPLSWIWNSYSTSASYRDSTPGSYLNQLEAIDWIFHDAGGAKLGYFVYDPSVITYGVDYLMNWRNKNVYRTSITNKKEKLTYLFLFPPLTGDLKAHDFWLKSTIKTLQKPYYQKDFPSGIKILKISFPADDPPVDPNYYTNLIFR